MGLDIPPGFGRGHGPPGFGGGHDPPDMPGFGGPLIVPGMGMGMFDHGMGHQWGEGHRIVNEDEVQQPEALAACRYVKFVNMNSLRTLSVLYTGLLQLEKPSMGRWRHLELLYSHFRVRACAVLISILDFPSIRQPKHFVSCKSIGLTASDVLVHMRR